jgi:hypothetical protein
MRGTKAESEKMRCGHCRRTLLVGKKTKGGAAAVGFGSCGMDRVYSTLTGGSKAPYTRENVCLCCDDCQAAKWAKDPDEYYELCTRVHEAQTAQREEWS